MPRIKNISTRPLTVMLLRRKSVALEPWAEAHITDAEVQSPHLQTLKASGKLSLTGVSETPPATPSQADTEPPPQTDPVPNPSPAPPPVVTPVVEPLPEPEEVPLPRGKKTGTRSRRKTTTSRKETD